MSQCPGAQPQASPSVFQRDVTLTLHQIVGHIREDRNLINAVRKDVENIVKAPKIVAIVANNQTGGREQMEVSLVATSPGKTAGKILGFQGLPYPTVQVSTKPGNACPPRTPQNTCPANTPGNPRPQNVCQSQQSQQAGGPKFSRPELVLIEDIVDASEKQIRDALLRNKKLATPQPNACLISSKSAMSGPVPENLMGFVQTPTTCPSYTCPEVREFMTKPMKAHQEILRPIPAPPPMPRPKIHLLKPTAVWQQKTPVEKPAVPSPAKCRKPRDFSTRLNNSLGGRRLDFEGLNRTLPKAPVFRLPSKTKLREKILNKSFPRTKRSPAIRSSPIKKTTQVPPKAMPSKSDQQCPFAFLVKTQMQRLNVAEANMIAALRNIKEVAKNENLNKNLETLDDYDMAYFEGAPKYDKIVEDANVETDLMNESMSGFIDASFDELEREIAEEEEANFAAIREKALQQGLDTEKAEAVAEFATQFNLSGEDIEAIDMDLVDDDDFSD